MAYAAELQRLCSRTARAAQYSCSSTAMRFAVLSYCNTEGVLGRLEGENGAWRRLPEPEGVVWRDWPTACPPIGEGCVGSVPGASVRGASGGRGCVSPRKRKERDGWKDA